MKTIIVVSFVIIFFRKKKALISDGWNEEVKRIFGGKKGRKNI